MKSARLRRQEDAMKHHFRHAIHQNISGNECNSKVKQPMTVVRDTTDYEPLKKSHLTASSTGSCP